MKGPGSRPVWLPGGLGMLASALKDRFELLGVPYVATDRELDITDLDRVMQFALTNRPIAIVNAAAYTRVDDAETQEDQATRINADGAEYLARAARELEIALLHFSTDYVFDGRGSNPYPEDFPTAPLTVYGKSKLLGEQRVLQVLQGSTGYVIRTSWLYGWGGPNFVKTMVGLMREREELKVVDDQQGRPTYTVDLAQASVDLLGLSGCRPARPGLYHFANTGVTSWYGFASRIRAASQELGLKLEVQRLLPCTTAEYPRPAPRPAYSVLDTSRVEQALGRAPRAWQDALTDYLIREFIAEGNSS